MSKRLSVIFIFLLVSISSIGRARNNDLVLDTIPPALLVNADAVIRSYDMDVKVISLDETDVVEDYVVTVFNISGDGFAAINEMYDKFKTISDISGAVYDKNGEKIETFKNSDIKDDALYDNSLSTDFRHKHYRCRYTSFPYTIKYTVAYTNNYSFFMPVWEPLEDLKCALQKATLKVTWNDSIAMRYKVYNSDLKPLLGKNEEGNVLSATLYNVPAKKEHDLFLNTTEFPTILLALNRFEIDGRKGDMDSWQNLGKFTYQLNAGRDELPDNIKKTVHQLTDSCKTTEQKISLLYDYLKSNYHYVSIQLGIGGWQTFEAKFVAEKGYGDCKALSNYMKALLKEASITSYQALVYAGRERHMPLDNEFPVNHFNHVILCIPLAVTQDTMWLECTSKTLPAGYLSDFTSNRKVLMLTPDGGKVIKTPRYNFTENNLIRNATMAIDSNDDITGKVSMNYSGNFWDYEDGYITSTTQKIMEDHFNEKFKFPSYKIVSYKYTDHKKGYIPSVEEELDIKGSSGITTTGKRVFFSLNFLSVPVQKYQKDESRLKPFTIRGYTVSDTIIVRLAHSYDTEYIPKETKLDYEFGSYHLTTELENNNTLRLIADYCQKEGTYAAGLFPSYVSMIKKVNSAENSKIVLLKKD